MRSNVDSSAISGTISRLQSHVVMREVSNPSHVNYRYWQLVQEMAQIVQSIGPPRGSSSPIGRLPTEILAEIFLCCIPEDANWAPAPDLAPMQLTAVCQRWREIAVNMPNLWRRLRLEIGHGDWQQRAFCYDSYLKRSRGRQLSLTLECDNNNWTELRSLLQPYVDQISSLHVGLSSGTSSFPLVPADFGGLEELAIYTSDGLDPVPAVTHSITHSITHLPPKMRSLRLLDVLLDFRRLTRLNSPSWAGLTNLEVLVVGVVSLPRLLRLCPNLSSLTMGGVFMVAIETSGQLAHTKLQSLRISGNLSTNSLLSGLLGLFANVTLPNLRIVEVSNIGGWAHEEFKALITRSQCPLESLIFRGRVTTTAQQRAEYVTLFPSLKLVIDTTRSLFLEY
ncbi:uncharacterized protein HD556DRAFT_1414793 [Suillus plorans]|uniref:F-box domain-containing protein n=1 Tax=Suillus plorans TaxID=116603 RepID=A0A9P7AEA1_9AGAM|nr:uncharacterized protein HD556DRAFT_1414793 [Suillus plorans]KAG1786555.1 hypothetical protein HD556DRAFT_1414793 [Suillus plorans]